MKRLMPNVQGVSVGEPKLSVVHSMRVAAASSPTTAGRRALKIDFMKLVSIYFKNSMLISSIRIKLGSTRAIVAVMLPRTLRRGSPVAFMTAV